MQNTPQSNQIQQGEQFVKSLLDSLPTDARRAVEDTMLEISQKMQYALPAAILVQRQREQVSSIEERINLTDILSLDEAQLREYRDLVGWAREQRTRLTYMEQTLSQIPHEETKQETEEKPEVQGVWMTCKQIAGLGSKYNTGYLPQILNTNPEKFQTRRIGKRTLEGFVTLENCERIGISQEDFSKYTTTQSQQPQAQQPAQETQGGGGVQEEKLEGTVKTTRDLQKALNYRQLGSANYFIAQFEREHHTTHADLGIIVEKGRGRGLRIPTKTFDIFLNYAREHPKKRRSKIERRKTPYSPEERFEQTPDITPTLSALLKRIPEKNSYDPSHIFRFLQQLNSTFFSKADAEKVVGQRGVNGTISGEELTNVLLEFDGLVSLRSKSTQLNLETKVGASYKEIAGHLTDPDIAPYIHTLWGASNKPYILKRELGELVHLLKAKFPQLKPEGTSQHQISISQSPPSQKAHINRYSTNVEYVRRRDRLLEKTGAMPSPTVHKKLVEAGVLIDTGTPEQIARSGELFARAMSGWRMFPFPKIAEQLKIEPRYFFTDLMPYLVREGVAKDVVEECLGRHAGKQVYVLRQDLKEEDIHRKIREYKAKDEQATTSPPA